MKQKFLAYLLAATVLIAATVLTSSPVHAEEVLNEEESIVTLSEEYTYFPEVVTGEPEPVAEVSAFAAPYGSLYNYAVNNELKLSGSFGTNQEFDYIIDGDNIIVTKYTGNYAYPSIPNVYEGKNVVIAQTIFTGAQGDLQNGTFVGPFVENYDVITVVFGDNVKIENNDASYMFYGCVLLQQGIDFDNDVTKMVATYYGCTSLEFGGTMPSSLVDVTEGFVNCINLMDVPDFYDGLLYMGGAFRGCEGLSSITTLPETVLDMNHSFQDCTGITYFPHIPSYVVNITEAFKGCTLIAGAVIFPDSVKDATGVLDDTVQPITVNCSIASAAAVVTYPTNVTVNVNKQFAWDFTYDVIGQFYVGTSYRGEDTTVNVPSTFRGRSFRMQADALRGNTKIVKVVFDKGAFLSTDIGTEMFMNCSKLTTVENIPNNIKVMNRAYVSCNSLVDAPEFPTSMTSANFTFAECINLKTPGTLPANVESLEYTYLNAGVTSAPVLPTTTKKMINTFDGCESLTGDITVPSSVVSFTGVFKDTVLRIDLYYDSMCLAVADCTVPGNVFKNPVGPLDWEYTRLGSGEVIVTKYIGTNPIVRIPEKFHGAITRYDVTTLFRGNIDIEEVIFGNAALSQYNGNYMFYNCINLKKIDKIPDGIYSINYGFYNCKNLEVTPNMPNSVSSATFGFYGCAKITATPDISNIVNATNMFRNAKALTTVVGKFDNCTIASNAFNGCAALTGTVEFGPNVTTFVDVLKGTTQPITLVYPTGNTAIKNCVLQSNITRAPY